MSGEIPKQLVARAFDVFEAYARSVKVEPCSINFLGGMGAAIGIITGSLDVGIPEGTPSDLVLQQLIREVHEHSEHLQTEIAKAEFEQRMYGNRAERRKAGR